VPAPDVLKDGSARPRRRDGLHAAPWHGRAHAGGGYGRFIGRFGLALDNLIALRLFSPMGASLLQTTK